MAKRKKRTPSYCAACGKQFLSPFSVQQHGALKHPETRRLLDLVVSQPPSNVVAQPTTGQTVNATHSSSSQRAPAVRVPPNTTPRIPRTPPRPKPQSGVDTLLAGQSKSERRLCCPLCPRVTILGDKRKLQQHKERCHPITHKCTICFFTTGKKRAMQGHLYKEHRASWRWVKNLYGDPPRPISYYVNRRAVPDQPSTGPPDDKLELGFGDEGQLASEDEGQLESEDEGQLAPGDEGPPASEDEDDPYFEDGGQLSSEGEQQYPPEGKGKQPARGDWQYFGCNFCPEAFPSERTLVMHMQFAHSWKCRYCLSLPPFPSVSLWREHRFVAHGLVDSAWNHEVGVDVTPE